MKYKKIPFCQFCLSTENLSFYYKNANVCEKCMEEIKHGFVSVKRR